MLWGKIFDPKSMISDGKCAVIVYWSRSGYTGYSNGRGTWKTVIFYQKPCTYNRYLICERKLGMTKLAKLISLRVNLTENQNLKKNKQIFPPQLARSGGRLAHLTLRSKSLFGHI